jgi:hypothetical protein
VFGEIRMLKKHDVIIRPGGCDRVPYAAEGVFAVFGIERDLKDSLVVRCANAGIR